MGVKNLPRKNTREDTIMLLKRFIGICVRDMTLNIMKNGMTTFRKVLIENDKIKLLWDINIQCENVIEATRPEIVVIDKKERVYLIEDITVPADRRVEEKEQEKVEKYQDLKREIGRMLEIRKVQVVPVVIGALRSVSKRFDKWIEKLDIQCNFVDIQKTALLGTARILRQVLEM